MRVSFSVVSRPKSANLRDRKLGNNDASTSFKNVAWFSL